MAATYRDFEAKFTETMEARAAWEQNTEGSRHLAIAAHSEYMRRNPDARLLPLRSAEPPKPAGEEKTALIPDRAEHETPQWVTELAERNRAALEKIEETHSLRMPAEDHEWEDIGEAWPDELRRERDAVIQPPKPEIRPAEPVAEAARELARQHAEQEAGE
jgi:hypothetical protein